MATCWSQAYNLQHDVLYSVYNGWPQKMSIYLTVSSLRGKEATCWLAGQAFHIKT